VSQNKFREDLYYRLNVVQIELPPLRERPEDISLLTTHFTQKYARPGHPPAQLTPEAMDLLLNFSWPGNIRQLENAIERACITASDGIITPKQLPLEPRTGSPSSNSQMSVDISRPLPDQLAEVTSAFEKRYLRKMMRKTRGHVGRCAKLSGLSRRSITDKIAQYGIDKSEFKQE
jgi:DNA-binding NtrC family response regulator